MKERKKQQQQTATKKTFQVFFSFLFHFPQYILLLFLLPHLGERERFIVLHVFTKFLMYAFSPQLHNAILLLVLLCFVLFYFSFIYNGSGIGGYVLARVQQLRCGDVQNW